MGVLRMVVTGKDEQGKPWWQGIGAAANNAVGEAALESIAKNYEKGCFLQLQEKVNKKNTVHFTVEATGDEDKHKSAKACEIWNKAISDQANITEAKGTDFDTVWTKALSFNNYLDASTAVKSVAKVTPKNTVLVLGLIDDNGGWKVEEEVPGKSAAVIGETNADNAPNSNEGIISEEDAAKLNKRHPRRKKVEA